ncbi:MAG: hypothetical protein LBB61_09115 [Treponema sp.]|jgi:hypothetical protein|nr:hypothetical protein [Treponema sp.]
MLNLANSFRLRNKLKERIGAVTSAIADAEFSKTEGTKESTSPCDGKTLEEAVCEVDMLMGLLQDLNVRIEKVNLVNRDSLIELETIKAKIAFYNTITRKCRRIRAYEFECDEKGERVKVAKEPLIDQGKMTAVLADLKKKKDALEEKIAAANFTTAVDIDPDTILSWI